MKTRAAVAFEAKKPLEIVEVDLEGPKEGEVLVEIMATGTMSLPNYGRGASTTPEGNNQYGNMGPSLPTGTCIARLGKEGELIRIGSRHQFKVRTDATLQVGVAIQNNMRNNISGTYKLRIRVLRQQPDAR